MRTHSLYLSDSFQSEVTLSVIKLPCKRILVSVHLLDFFLISDFSADGCLPVRCVSQKQQKFAFSFFNPVSLCVFIGELKPFTFRVII